MQDSSIYRGDRCDRMYRLAVFNDPDYVRYICQRLINFAATIPPYYLIDHESVHDNFRPGPDRQIFDVIFHENMIVGDILKFLSSCSFNEENVLYIGDLVLERRLNLQHSCCSTASVLGPVSLSVLAPIGNVASCTAACTGSASASNSACVSTQGTVNSASKAYWIAKGANIDGNNTTACNQLFASLSDEEIEGLASIDYRSADSHPYPRWLEAPLATATRPSRYYFNEYQKRFGAAHDPNRGGWVFYLQKLPPRARVVLFKRQIGLLKIDLSKLPANLTASRQGELKTLASKPLAELAAMHGGFKVYVNSVCLDNQHRYDFLNYAKNIPRPNNNITYFWNNVLDIAVRITLVNDFFVDHAKCVIPSLVTQEDRIMTEEDFCRRCLALQQANEDLEAGLEIMDPVSFAVYSVENSPILGADGIVYGRETLRSIMSTMQAPTFPISSVRIPPEFNVDTAPIDVYTMHIVNWYNQREELLARYERDHASRQTSSSTL